MFIAMNDFFEITNVSYSKSTKYWRFPVNVFNFARKALFLAFFLLPLVLLSCGKKEENSPSLQSMQVLKETETSITDSSEAGRWQDSILNDPDIKRKRDSLRKFQDTSSIWNDPVVKRSNYVHDSIFHAKVDSITRSLGGKLKFK
jgi:hypothetical protein